MTIRVPERGAVTVSNDEWLSLSGHREFWDLVDAKIIKVERRSAGWSLQGQCYVGRAVVGDTVVQATEKVAGSFAALVRALSVHDAKVLATAAPSSDDDYTAALLVSLFVQATRRYLSSRKLVGYTQTHERGALVGGRLDVAGTARLRARGMVHQAAFLKTVLTADLPPNRALYAALAEVEKLSRILPIEDSDVAAARVLRVSMSECRRGAMDTSSARLAEVAYQEGSAMNRKSVLGDALSLAAAILDGAGFGGSGDWTRTVRRSWFVNLENMFERAVRLAIGEALPQCAVSGPQLRPSLFQSFADRYRANPDVLIRSGPDVIAIADAKYKELDGLPAAADVYELLAHAAAYKAQSALLVYPTDAAARLVPLGVAATGCNVWALEVPFANFRAAISNALEQINLVPPSSLH